jgi:hypothetical protein
MTESCCRNEIYFAMSIAYKTFRSCICRVEDSSLSSADNCNVMEVLYVQFRVTSTRALNGLPKEPGIGGLTMCGTGRAWPSL